MTKTVSKDSSELSGSRKEASTSPTVKLSEMSSRTMMRFYARSWSLRARKRRKRGSEKKRKLSRKKMRRRKRQWRQRRFKNLLKKLKKMTTKNARIFTPPYKLHKKIKIISSKLRTLSQNPSILSKKNPKTRP